MTNENVTVEQNGALLVATITTPLLSISEAQEIVQELADHMRYDNARLFVLDMREVEFIDSACIGALVQFLQDLEHIHGKIALANCQANVAFLFKVTRLDQVFPMFDTTDEATEMLKAA